MNERNKAVISVLLLILVASSLFIYTVDARQEWFGFYSGKNHDWLSASTLIFTSNWHEEGALNLKFGQYELPRSPESRELLDRKPYISYPPGAVIPLYLLMKAMTQEPTLGFIMAYNLGNHLLITITLMLTVFFFLRSVKVRTGIAFAFALIPAFLELLLPAPFYFHQNTFYSDQAVMLPFALAVFLEVIRDGLAGRKKTVADSIQSLIFLYGLLTDWLFFFVILVFYVKRVLTGEYDFRQRKQFINNTISFALVPVVALNIFIIHAIVTMQGDIGLTVTHLKNKFLGRSGATDTGTAGGDGYLSEIIGHIEKGFGIAGLLLLALIVVLLIAMAIYAFLVGLGESRQGGQKNRPRRNSKKRPKPGKGIGVGSDKALPPEVKSIALLAFILLAPCVMQILVFMNHSAIHNFSALKLSLPLAVIPFVLLPVGVVFMVSSRSKRIEFSSLMVVALTVSSLLAGAYLIVTHPGHSDYFGRKNQYWYEIIELTNSYTLDKDVVFSPEMDVPYHPPQLLSLTMKQVHLVRSVNEVFEIAARAEGDHRIVMMLRKAPQPETFWSMAAESADQVVDDNAYVIYFSPASFADFQERFIGFYSEMPADGS